MNLMAERKVMNLLSYDEILRTLMIGMIAAFNIVVAYYLTSIPMDRHIKQLTDKNAK